MGGAIRQWGLDGSGPKPLTRVSAAERLLRWDGADSLLVGSLDRRTGYVDRLKIGTGARTRVNQIEMLDGAGVLFDPFLIVSQNGEAYAYSSSRFLNSLYLVSGLR